MKNEGIIPSCVVSLDLSKLGYQRKAFLLISMAPDSKKAKTINCLKKIRNVIVVTELSGPYDVLAIGTDYGFKEQPRISGKSYKNTERETRSSSLPK